MPGVVRNRREARWFARWAIFIVIFLLAFLPRVISPVSWPMQWYNRSVRFIDALLARDWAGTYQRYHPGVTTMWLSGIALKLFAWHYGLSSDQLLGTAPTKPYVLNRAVTTGVIPLAFVIACCIVLSYGVLNRLWGQKIAFVGCCLLAIDPFYLTYSRVLHVDALLATFMLLSALHLIGFLKLNKRIDLVLSGAFGGLAFLSKSSSLFLTPYTALVIGAYIMTMSPMTTAEQTWGRQLWKGFRLFILWSIVAIAIFVVLWPAMWVNPLRTLFRIGKRIIFHVETAHYNPVFFNGRITHKDPGPLFYLATIAWKTTSVTLPMIGAALVFVLLCPLRNNRSNCTIVWSLIAYVVFFVAQMSLSARKELAYLLPVFPALDVIAALGLVQCTEISGGLFGGRHQEYSSIALVGLALVSQASLVLSHHPYYGTHHNALLGGSKTAQYVLPLQDQGEGLDLAARYLNTLPRAQRATAGIHQRGAGIFRRNFIGLTSTIDNPKANYRIYFANQIMRNLSSATWEEIWRRDQQTDPLWTVDFDGVTYVWVYGSPPQKPAAEGPEYEMGYRLGEHIQLKRVRINTETLTPSDTLTVVPIWVSDGEVESSYKVFCHLMSKDGELIAQRDGFPLDGIRHTPSWRADEIIEDSYDIKLNGNVPPGEYELSLGMYDPETLQRVPVYDEEDRLAHDRIVVDTLHLRASSEAR